MVRAMPDDAPRHRQVPAGDDGRVDVYKVDIDDRGMLDAVHRYNIMSVPTLMFFRRGEVLWRESGRVGYDHLVNVLRELEKREQVAQR